MFDNLGFSELFVVGLLALLVFGPERLPEMARTAGKLIARFRAEASRSIADLKAAADIDDLQGDIKAIKDELTAARSEITSSLREPADAVRQAADEAKQLTTGGPTAEVAPAPAAPPFDPEST